MCGRQHLNRAIVCVNERQLQRGQSSTIERRCNGESYALGIEMSCQLLSGAIDHPRPEPMLIAHHLLGRRLQIPDDADPGERPQDVESRVDLPPSKTLPRAA